VTVIEVHPEELLDRELRGTLTEREHQLLVAHLKRCSACRMERQLRADFERELSVPGQALDLQMFVSGAMQAIENPGPPARPGFEAQGTRRSKRHGWSAMQRAVAIMVACAALSAGVGIATAQFGLAERAWRLVRESVDASLGSRATRTPVRRMLPARHATAEGSRQAPVSSAPALPPVRTVPPARVAARRAEMSRAPAAIAPDQRPAAKSPALPPAPRSGSAAPSAPIASRQLAPGASRVAASRTLDSVPAMEPAVDARAPRPAQKSNADGAGARASSESPAVLFENANMVRHRGHAIEASGLYRELQARYPHSAEARLSVAVVARMQLDRGEHRAALSGFEAYLASSDPALREEAMVGRVRALQRLERARDARDAARELLDVYPQSAFAPQARRLLESSAP
jgi:hypothetical protein